jgi:outer membrane protein OmpA-like peptidoglycan-associated protein
MKKVVFILMGIASISTAQQKIDTVSLYFKNNVSKVNARHLQKIDSILTQTLPITSLKINGYANSLASFDYNLKLSEQRALNVARAFSDSIKIQIQGLGEVDALSAAFRRADIIITREIPVIVEKTDLPEATLESEMETAESGDIVTLEGMNFYPGVDIIRESSVPVANELVLFMTENPSVKIKINGHVCCGKYGKPSKVDGMNNRTRKKNLSEARAKAVYDFLIAQGIAKDRMTFEGLAFKFPLGKTDDEDRRVEVEILSK